MKVCDEIEVRTIQSILMWNHQTSLKKIRVNNNRKPGVISNAEFRQYVDVVLAWYSNLTMVEIGFTTRRNHSSVNHSTEKINQQIELFNRYGKKSEFLKNFEVFESRFICTMNERGISIKRRYRSYKDELKSAEICTP
jgi:chromosomal replication initiation ATPase DnaA